MTLLHARFAAAAARFPDRVAVRDGDRVLTYAELDRAANRLAHRLRALGAGPEVLVGLCGERSAELVVGVLGILKSGAGYLPLDPRYPAARLAATVADAGCAIVAGEVVAIPGTTSVPLSGPDFAAEPDTAPGELAGPGDVAYVIYTSGSTGRPKGVVVSHANVTRLFDVTTPEFGFTEHDVWTLFHSIAFDFSVWELWGALLHGGELVVVSYADSRDPDAFAALVAGRGVTVLNQTPTAFRRFASAAEAAGYPATALRAVVFGGEKLDVGWLRRWFAHHGDTGPRLVNMYGITETTVHVTLRDVTAADLALRHSPIGRPLADLRVHVLDEHLEPVRRGTPGEMYVGGPGVTRGYLGRPELTAERFVRDPFGEGTLYRTGDVAELTADGELLFHGRADDQVQLRGFRIEPGEIEAAIQAHPAVREAVVVVREDVPGEERLVCYWVGAEAAGSATGLREAAARVLPEHMLPSAFVALPALPMTVNGKLDRAALPAPVAGGARSGGDRTAPRDVVERGLAEIWAELLGVETVGVHESFFALGGDSIRAIPLVAKAKSAGYAVTVADLFAAPTVAGLAARSRVATRLGEAAAAGDAGEYLAAAPEGVRAAYPASALQQGIIFHAKVSGDPVLYHDLVSVQVAAPLEIRPLRRVLRALAARHEILRTSFDLGTHREVVQLVHEDAVIPLSEVDVPADRAGARAWWAIQRRTGFDLATAPLLRCHVLADGPGSFRLALSAHHSVLDGWSFALLITELLTGYDRELAGLGALSTSDTAEPLPYEEFVALERAEAASPPAAAFWRDRLAGSDPTRLPGPGPAVAGEPPGVDPDVRLPLPEELTAGVARLAAELGTPVKSVYLAAHLAALGRVGDRKDVVTGVVVNGRPERAGAERTLGLFLNSVPLRVDLAGLSGPDLVAASFAAEREIMAHRRFPLARIRRERGGLPFAVLFNYTSFHVIGELDRLENVRVLDWWGSDRNSFGVSVEIGRPDRTAHWELSVTVDPAETTVAAARLLAGTIVEELWDLVAGGRTR